MVEMEKALKPINLFEILKVQNKSLLKSTLLIPLIYPVHSSSATKCAFPSRQHASSENSFYTSTELSAVISTIMSS